MADVIWIIAGLLGIAGTVREEIVRRRIQPYYDELNQLAAKLMQDRALLNKIINAYQTKRNDMAQELLISSPVGESFIKLKKAIRTADKAIDRQFEISGEIEKQLSDIDQTRDQLTNKLTDNPFKKKTDLNKFMLDRTKGDYREA